MNSSSHRDSGATGLGWGAKKGPGKGRVLGVDKKGFEPKCGLEGPAELLRHGKGCGGGARGVSSSTAGAVGGV